MMKSKTKFKQTKIGMIPEDWDVVEVGELIRHRKGCAFKSQWFQSSGKRIVKVSDFTSDSIDTSKTLFMDEEKAKEFHDFEIHEGDIIVATVGSWPNNPASIVGKVIRVPKKADGSLLNQNAVILRTKNSNKLNQEFLYHRLRTKDFSHYVISGAQGSANQASITLRDVFTFEFGLPEIKEQERIADVFSKINRKIFVNKQMNKTLEAIGQAIFKHWFVDFEFPNEEGKPYKSSGGEMRDSELGKIPNGWKIMKLCECVNVVKGCSYRSDDLKESETALVTLKSINRGGGLNQEGYKEYVGEYNENQILKDGEIVVAQTDLTQKAEVIGRPAIVNSLVRYSTLVASLDLQIVRPKNNFSKNYVYYLLKTEEFHNHALSYTNGTTVLHLNKNAIPEFISVIPPKEILDKFDNIIESILTKTTINEAEIQTLSNLRDSLLPKLMSGKIRVPVEA